MKLAVALLALVAGASAFTAAPVARVAAPVARVTTAPVAVVQDNYDKDKAWIRVPGKYLGNNPYVDLKELTPLCASSPAQPFFSNRSIVLTAALAAQISSGVPSSSSTTVFAFILYSQPHLPCRLLLTPRARGFLCTDAHFQLGMFPGETSMMGL